MNSLFLALVLSSPSSEVSRPLPVVVDPAIQVRAMTALDTVAGTPEWISEEEFQEFKAALHAVAIRREIMDFRETSSLFASYDNYQSDLDILRQRLADYGDYPPLSDVERLPARELVNQRIKFNQEYHRYLKDRLIWELDRADVLVEAIAETEAAYRVWDYIRDARCEYYNVTTKREALKNLKLAIGEDAYLRGEWPNSVPVHRFVTK